MTIHKKTWFTLATALFLAQAVTGYAQEPGWRKVGDGRPGQAPPPEALPPDDQGPPQQQPYPQQQNPQAYAPGPLVLPAGSWITVRVNQPLSTDHNQQGDAFTATLAQPLVADGRVVARRGQMVAGRVVDVQKSGRVKGTARISIELTELSLVDGQQVPIRTQFADRGSDTSVGRDIGAVAAATGAGAAIGAAADGGFGAGIGAIAGAAASTIGVLATRGNNAAVYPETLLTFRLEAPVPINTSRSEQAFQPVTQDVYDQRQPNYSYRNEPPPQRAGVAPYYGYSPYPYYGYPGYYAPYGGASFFFYSGPRYYGRSYGYRGGYRRR